MPLESMLLQVIRQTPRAVGSMLVCSLKCLSIRSLVVYRNSLDQIHLLTPPTSFVSSNHGDHTSGSMLAARGKKKVGLNW